MYIYIYIKLLKRWFKNLLFELNDTVYSIFLGFLLDVNKILNTLIRINQ